jgi:hypothetical protein
MLIDLQRGQQFDPLLSVTMLFDGSSFALFDGGSQFRFRAVVERTGTGTGNRRAVEA